MAGNMKIEVGCCDDLVNGNISLVHTKRYSAVIWISTFVVNVK